MQHPSSRNSPRCRIPAAALNSTLSDAEQSALIAASREGRYRLLYVSPERLGRADTLDWLARVPISFFAIDEAHCISEWGHEFRPDYRQLSRLREHFPDRPIAAFTASATRRVRHDIIDQLQLRDPDKYIASFHRPNLSYIVKECEKGTQSDLLLKTLRRQYGQQHHCVRADHRSRGRNGRVSWRARHPGHRIPRQDGCRDAKAKSGTMDVRRSARAGWHPRVWIGNQQERAARAVIHLSLPKSIEQFYQEAAAPGAMEIPPIASCCGRSVTQPLLVHFTKEISDAAEQQRAWATLSRNRSLRGARKVPPSPDLRPFWRESEMEARARRVTHAAASRSG